MAAITRTTDPKARVSLPRSFANSTVVIEQVNETELRIRKARIVTEDELRLREQSPTTLSDRDRDRFLELLDSPPRANRALRHAAASYLKRRPAKKRHG